MPARSRATRTIHVFEHRADLSEIEKDIAAIAYNDRWTSFVPKKPTTFESLPISELLGVPVFDMWFDEATGIVTRLHQHGMVVGVFTLPEKHPNAYDARELAEALEMQDVLTKAQTKTLKKRAADAKTFATWTRERGLETLLGLPELNPPPKKRPVAAPKKRARRSTP